MEKFFFRIAIMGAMGSSALGLGAEQKSNKNMENINMGYQIETKEVAAQPALVIKGKSKIDDVGSAIGAILGKVEAHLKTKKVGPTGAPFTRTFNFENGVLEFEAGFPVAPHVAGLGEIIATELPKGLVVTTVHSGSQEESPKAYEAVQKWMETNKMKEGGAPWEVYLSDPSTTAPEKNKMQVFFPVR